MSRLSALAFLLLLTSTTAHAEETDFRLGLPIACIVGKDCFVQSLVDLDDGPGRLDHQCAKATYDGHKGTDFRLRNIGALLQDVPVLAAAPGRVVRLRDSIRDDLQISGQYTQQTGAECGNGMVIDHGDGWETQYCHMRQGSLFVKEGEEVAAGQPIGHVGMSGKTEFPHLHLSVRHKGKVIDPYSSLTPGDDCKSEKVSLWTDKAASALSGPTLHLVDFTFTDMPVKPVQLERFRQNSWPVPDRNGPALVAFSRVINLTPKDTQTIVIKGPEGVVVERPIDPPERFKARYVAYLGKKTPRGGWPRGTYQATYKLEREGQVLIEETIEITL